MSSPQTTADVVDAIRANDRFLVTTHENPDGDALGSCWPPSSRSTRSGRTSSCTSQERHRSRASTRGCRSGTCAAPSRRMRQTVCSSPSTVRTRAGSGRTPRCSRVPRSSSMSTTITTTPASAASTSSSPMPRRRARSCATSSELGVELTPEIAEALYIALVTDTGRFQYTNTTPKALRLAAELVEAGADVHKIFQGVYESVQFAKLKLLARALERAQIYEGGRLVISYLLRDDFKEVGAAEPYSEGIIDYLRAVEAPTWPCSSGNLLAAMRRHAGSASAPRRTSSTSRDRPALRRRWRPSAGRGLLERQVDRGDHGVHPQRVRRGDECPRLEH